MSITVRIPPSVRALTGGRSEVQAEGETVAVLIAALDREYSGFDKALCDEKGGLRRFVAVFVNGVDVRTLSGLATELEPGAEVDVVGAIAGG